MNKVRGGTWRNVDSKIVSFNGHRFVFERGVQDFICIMDWKQIAGVKCWAFLLITPLIKIARMLQSGHNSSVFIIIAQSCYFFLPRSFSDFLCCFFFRLQISYIGI